MTVLKSFKESKKNTVSFVQKEIKELINQPLTFRFSCYNILEYEESPNVPSCGSIENTGDNPECYVRYPNVCSNNLVIDKPTDLKISIKIFGIEVDSEKIITIPNCFLTATWKELLTKINTELTELNFANLVLYGIDLLDISNENPNQQCVVYMVQPLY